MQITKCILLLFVVIFLSPSVLRAEFLGVNYNENNSQVVKIDETTGASTLVGLSGFSRLNSMARNRQGTIYSASSNKLITINPVTGEGTNIATLSADIRGMGFSAADVLYGIKEGRPDYLVTINTGSGAVSLVGNTGLWGIQALEFSPAGILYGWDVGSGYLSSGHGLVTIDPATGVSTPVSSTIGTIDVQTLAFGNNSELYGAGKGAFYSIDVGTGAATLIGTGNYLDLRGIAFFPVPEPSTLALLCIGGIGLIAWSWRRNCKAV
jgi:hypothetical protein